MTFALACNRNALARMALAGGAWGVTLASRFFAMNALQCGLPCREDAAVTAAICVATGIGAIGPLAAFAAPR